MTLAGSILINALTRLVSRNAEAPNINVSVAATFAEPNRIVVAPNSKEPQRGAARRRNLSV